MVDDGSSDDSAEVARRLGARVLSLEPPLGAGGARNAGAAAARHAHLCFVDADVVVHPETLGRLAANFMAEPDIDAVFGSYDDRPGKKNIASQYRNLLHHAVHQMGNRDAMTFWSGLGAIKKSAFESVRGFDAEFQGRIEDIDLGLRLHRKGSRIVLDKSATATHLKEWTLWSMLVCDVRERAIPWTRLILADGALPDDLNLRWTQRLCAAFSCALFALLAAGATKSSGILMLLIFGGAGLWLADHWTRTRTIPLTVKLTAGLLALTMITMTMKLPPLTDSGGQTGLGVGFFLLLTIIVVNRGFYRSVWTRNPRLLVAAVPLHVGYFVYSTLAFGAGAVLYYLRGPPGPAIDQS